MTYTTALGNNSFRLDIHNGPVPQTQPVQDEINAENDAAATAQTTGGTVTFDKVCKTYHASGGAVHALQDISCIFLLPVFLALLVALAPASQVCCARSTGLRLPAAAM